jgi:hypothetical protein
VDIVHWEVSGNMNCKSDIVWVKSDIVWVRLDIVRWDRTLSIGRSLETRTVSRTLSVGRPLQTRFSPKIPLAGQNPRFWGNEEKSMKSKGLEPWIHSKVIGR